LAHKLQPFERVLKTHQSRVFSFCFRMMGSRDEAMDITQETFTSVYQHLGSFRKDSLLSTWILRIAKNLCLNRLRHLARQGAGSSEPLEEVSDEVLSGHLQEPQRPDDAVDAKRQQAAVQRAIALLEEELRVLVVLRDIEGLSYGEIAEVTDQPEGTVKSRLHRARERLAELLGKGG
jgi:RNA polymerase sigma-70 factor (ECF subfamily)